MKGENEEVRKRNEGEKEIGPWKRVSLNECSWMGGGCL